MYEGLPVINGTSCTFGSYGDAASLTYEQVPILLRAGGHS
jgi:hypothetical protein